MWPWKSVEETELVTLRDDHVRLMERVSRLISLMEATQLQVAEIMSARITHEERHVEITKAMSAIMDCEDTSRKRINQLSLDVKTLKENQPKC